MFTLDWTHISWDGAGELEVAAILVNGDITFRVVREEPFIWALYDTTGEGQPTLVTRIECAWTHMAYVKARVYHVVSTMVRNTTVELYKLAAQPA